MICRHGTTDADDPQTAEALALAERDPELKDWLMKHCARQFVLSAILLQIAAPTGLKEQILSEKVAQEKIFFWRPRLALAETAVILLIGILGFSLFPKQETDDTLAIHQSRMVAVASRGYGMDLMTNDPAQIHAFLAQNYAPADFVSPGALGKTALAG